MTRKLSSLRQSAIRPVALPNESLDVRTTKCEEKLECDSETKTVRPGSVRS